MFQTDVPLFLFWCKCVFVVAFPTYCPNFERICIICAALVTYEWHRTSMLLYIVYFAHCIKLIYLQSIAVVANLTAVPAEELKPQDEPTTGFSASFKGNGYIQLPKSFSNWLRTGGMSLEMVTREDDGLLMYHGDRNVPIEDSEFIALAVQDGYVEMRYYTYPFT